MTEQTEKRDSILGEGGEAAPSNRRAGHPPWTEAQKQARRDMLAKKKAEAEAAERAAEQEYARQRDEAQEPAKKRKGGHPPWTEEQKAARRALTAWKKEQMATLEGEELEEFIRTRKDGRKPWTEAEKAKYMATRAKTRAKRDEERKAMIAANPNKSKNELGIHCHWKPSDGSDSGYRGVMLRQARVGISLPPINIKDPKQVEQRVNEYFDFCESADKIPNPPGLANWIGISKSTLNNWLSGAANAATHTPIIQRAYSVMEEVLVSSMQNDTKANVNAMFMLKSTFGYKEQQDIVIQAGDGRKEMSNEDIAKWFLDDGKTVETTFTEDE